MRKEGMMACGCSTSEAVCEQGRAFLEQVAGWYEVVTATSFVCLPRDVREQAWDCYEQARKNYFEHVDHRMAEVR